MKPSASKLIKLLFAVCFTICLCKFLLDASHFHQVKRNQAGSGANINQNHLNIHELTFHYWKGRNFVNSMSATPHEMKYSQSIFHENSIQLPSWDERNLLNQTDNSRYKAFDQRITATDHGKLVALLQVFQDICRRNNIQFMLYGGSLLGAYRHFGLVPWDDDIDVFVNSSEKFQLLNSLNMNKTYRIDAPKNRQWKFYQAQSVSDCVDATAHITKSVNNICKDEVKWPYIDIFFYKENETHIWDEIPMYSSTYVFKKRDVFPLSLSPFEQLDVPVARCTAHVLSKSYNVELCVTPIFSHKFEKLNEEKQLSVPCKRLFKLYPFVFESMQYDILLRYLVFNNNIISVTFSNPC